MRATEADWDEQGSAYTAPTAREWDPMLQKLELLGEGAFGEVWKVRSTCSGDTRIMALKIIRDPGNGKTRNYRKETFDFMMNERRTMMALAHPFLAEELDVAPRELPDEVGSWNMFKEQTDNWDWKLAILMEYFPGNSLSVAFVEWSYWRKSDQRLEIFSTLGAQITNALLYMHDKGVIHRDLKPGNLLVKTPSTQCLEDPSSCLVKIGDFGLACIMEGFEVKNNSIQTCKGKSIAGTPAYLSPEMLRGHLSKPRLRIPAQPSQDTWAAGIVLLELWLGRHPLEMQDGEIDTSAIDTLSSSSVLERSGLPKPYQAIIAGLLQPNPRYRMTAWEAAELWKKESSLEFYNYRIHNEELRALSDATLPACFHQCLPKNCRDRYCYVKTTRTPPSAQRMLVPVGTVVECFSWLRRRWTRGGKILRANADGTYDTEEQKSVPAKLVRVPMADKNLQEGSRVQYLSPGTMEWSDAVVEQRNSDGSYRLDIHVAVPRDRLRSLIPWVSQLARGSREYSYPACENHRCPLFHYRDGSGKCVRWCTDAAEKSPCEHGAGSCHFVENARTAGRYGDMMCVLSAPEVPCTGRSFQYNGCESVEASGLMRVMSQFTKVLQPACGCGYYDSKQMHCVSGGRNLDELTSPEKGFCQYIG